MTVEFQIEIAGVRFDHPVLNAAGTVKTMADVIRMATTSAGAGGVRSGRDVLDYQRAGATMVQIATAYFEEGPSVFYRVLAELVDLADTADLAAETVPLFA